MRKTCPIILSISIAVASSSLAWAGPGDLNSTNTGKNILGGTYYNTPGSRSTFINPGGSLHLRKGQLVRGLESNVNKTISGHGGTIYLRAPGNVIRLDGDINVSAVKNGEAYTGNGGKLLLDSAYLFQTGNIYANGFNGGVVQMNVGAATIASGAKTTAQGFGGNGGVISINAPGAIDIQKGAILDTSGKVSGTFDTNVISIIGGAVNNQGIIRASGVSQDLNPSSGDKALMQANPRLANNPTPPTISAGTGTGQILFGPPLEWLRSKPASTRGGTIRLVATGQSWAPNKTLNNTSSTVLSVQEKRTLQNTASLLKAVDGTIINQDSLLTEGTRGQIGGTILISAAKDIINTGKIKSNGISGGTISLNSLGTIANRGLIEANGTAGTGGLVAFSYNNMLNPGKITANGKKGGLIVFAGDTNPLVFGTIQARQNGIIVAPQLTLVPKSLMPANSSQWVQTQRNELLVHGENALLLSRANGPGAGSNTLTGRLTNAVIRTVENGKGIQTNKLAFIKHRSNFVFAGQGGNPANPNGLNALSLNFDNANINPIFSRPNTLMVLNSGNVNNNMHWSPGVNLVGPGSHDTVFALGGGHISLLSSGSVTNNGFLLTRGLWAGGSINVSAKQNVINNKVMLTTTFNKDLASGYAPAPGYISSHSGSMILKAMNNINNTHRLNTNLAFLDIHPPLNTPELIWPVFLNSASIGANNYLQAGNQIFNSGNARISADAVTYRNGQLGADNPANAFGGIVNLKAGGRMINNGQVTVEGRSYDGFADGRSTNNPRFGPGTQWNELSPTVSFAGNIIRE